MYFLKLAREVIHKADIILLVGDARLPEMSSNKEVQDIINKDILSAKKHKHLIHVFNKADLVPEMKLEEYKKQFSDTFFVSAMKNEGVRELRTHLLILGKRMKLDSPKICVVGYPNVGKSALINALAYRARARVAHKPGTTRGIQWIKAGSLRILDSPGVIPFADKESELALIGAKSPEKLDNPEKIALDMIKQLCTNKKEILKERYNLSESEIGQEPYDILLSIGRKRGFLSKGGEVDETKTAIMIIMEWQRGRLRF